MRTSTTLEACVDVVETVIGGTGSMCRTRKSCAIGTVCCQTFGCTVTDALLSTEVSVVGRTSLTFLLVAGMESDEPSRTVTLIRNGFERPTWSRIRPVMACAPGASAPVGKVRDAPLIAVLKDAGDPSRRTEATDAIDSDATAAIESTDGTTEPSPGVEETSVGAVLSTRTLLTTTVVLLPKRSLTVARTS